MRPHCSHSRRENATPSSSTSLLASCKGVPPGLGVLLLPPVKVPPQRYVAGTLLYTWVKRDKVELSFLFKETLQRARLEPWSSRSRVRGVKPLRHICLVRRVAEWNSFGNLSFDLLLIYMKLSDFEGLKPTRQDRKAMWVAI